MKSKGLLIAGLLWMTVAGVGAQEANKPAPAAAEAPKAEAVKAKALEKVAPSAEFLKGWDKLNALLESAREAEDRRKEYEAAGRVLNEQIKAIVEKLQGQVPKGYGWDAAARTFVIQKVEEAKGPRVEGSPGVGAVKP